MENLYTKESLEALNTPKSDSKFAKAYNPRMFSGILAVVILLAGAIVWGLFGSVQVQTTIVGSNLEEDQGKVLLFIEESDLEEVKEGQQVTINGVNCTIKNISQYPVQIIERESGYYSDPNVEDLNEIPDLYENYVLYYSGQPSGTWFYTAEADYNGDYETIVFNCTVISEKNSPVKKLVKALLNRL